MNRRTQLTLAALAVATSLIGCSTTDHSKAPALQRNASWVVLPFENHTETPMAGNRAEAIASAVLHAKGIGSVQRYTASSDTSDMLFGSASAKGSDAAMSWAKEKGANYILTGTVDEWRYKVGVDGEPAVGVSLRIIDASNGTTLWSGAGGKSGWSREALSSVAQKLIRNLLDSGLSASR